MQRYSSRKYKNALNDRKSSLTKRNTNGITIGFYVPRNKCLHYIRNVVEQMKHEKTKKMQTH